MKIRIRTVGGSVNEWDIKSNGPIYIDLDPTETERIGPGDGNGFMGPECLVQMDSNGTRGLVVGFKIIPERGRDDSKFFSDVAISEIPKV